MRISDWSSDVCSSDLPRANPDFTAQTPETRTFTDADGKVWTLHQIATFADSTIRFTGEVYTWPVEWDLRSEEHTSELQSLMRISSAVFCLKKKRKTQKHDTKLNTETRRQT